MTTRARAVALTATALLVLPLTACGSQDASDAASAAASLPPTPSAASTTSAPTATTAATASTSAAPALATAPDQSASQQAGDPVGTAPTTAGADAGAAGGTTSSAEDVAGAKASAQAWIDALAANNEDGVIEHSMEDVWRTVLADRSPSIGLKGVLQQPGATWTVGDPVTGVQAPSALLAREGAPVTGDMVLPVTSSLDPSTPQTYVGLTWGQDAGWMVADYQEIDADAS